MSESNVRPDGLKIREARKAKGWTQEQLAVKSGYALSVIQKVETGKYFGGPCLEACVEALGEAYDEQLLITDHPGPNVAGKPHDNGQVGNADLCSVKHTEDTDAADPPTKGGLEDSSIEKVQSPASPAEGGGVIVQTGTTPIELVIDRDFDSYSLREQERLLSAIKQLLGISGDIRVIRKRPGSVKLTLALTPGQAEKLILAVRAGDLAKFGVVDAKLFAVETSQAEEVTLSLAALNAGDEAAAAEAAARALLELYRHRVISLAQRRLKGELQALVDAEEVASEVFEVLFDGLRRGRFQQVRDQNDLWQLLVVITAKKASDLVRREAARHKSAHYSTATILEEILYQEPPVLAQVSEDYQRLLNFQRLLNNLDPKLRSISVWKMEGLSNDEIAAKLGYSIRTVERKWKLILTILEKESQEQE